jgi:DNA-binding HxlR family transcriptional regulator
MKNKEKKTRNRDVQDVIELIGGRWRGAILASLCDKPKRFNELKRDLGNITPRVLTKELKYLEMNQLVNKEANSLAAASVLYFLTEHGKSIEPVIEKISAWAQKHRRLVMTP